MKLISRLAIAVAVVFTVALLVEAPHLHLSPQATLQPECLLCLAAGMSKAVEHAAVALVLSLPLFTVLSVGGDTIAPLPPMGNPFSRAPPLSVDSSGTYFS